MPCRRHWQLAGLVVIPDRFAPVLAELAPLAERFAAAGHRLYLVGGTVRDLLIGATRPATTTTSTDTTAVRQIKAMPAGLGRRGLDAGRALRHDRRPARRPHYEITTHRAEAYDADSRKPRRRVRRRHRGRSVAARLHGQRHGAGAHRRLARRWSTRSAAPPIWRRARAADAAGARGRASATTRCACCGRRASSPAIGCSR